jgi:hypothetical protein
VCELFLAVLNRASLTSQSAITCGPCQMNEHRPQADSLIAKRKLSSLTTATISYTFALYGLQES